MLSAQSSTGSAQPPLEVLRGAIDAELELRRRRRSWQPTFRGASAQAQEITDHEWMSLGPAESAKTWGISWRLDTLARETPRGRGLIVRKVRADMTASVLVTFDRVSSYRGAPEKFGGNDVRWYDYPNGFRLYVVGLDRSTKVLSGEFDFIYINQAEELTLADWETLSTRCTGRGSVSKTPMIFGDCNPGPPNHWILKRTSLTRLYASHRDNPTLYDDAGNLTEQGVKTMAVLDALTGVRQKRLRDGLWVAAEGVVYDGFDRSIHLIRRGDAPAMRRWVGSIDWGFTNPSVFQLWGIDGDGRMYLWREIYRTQRLAQDFAEDIKALLRSEGLSLERLQGLSSGTGKAERSLEAIVADHDAEDRATIHRAGVPTRAAIKEIGAGIQKVQARMRVAGDGRPRIFYLEDAVVERDADLLEKHLPTCTVDELEVYAYPKAKDGRPIKEVPVDLHNHGCDAKRYAVEYVDRAAGPQPSLEERVRARVDATGVDPADLTARHLVYERERTAEKARTGKPRLLPTTLGRLRYRR
ncbi:MAG TPA: hypothetical protein PK569_21920 [Thermoanaerobaculia bacterium]|nr:hypothetical protein [Thermoanaerobaculia bacterium]